MFTDKGFRRFLLNLSEELSYHLGFTLRGFSVKYKEESCLLVVKVTSRLGGAQVAFIEAESLVGCFNYLYQHCTKTNAPLKFRPDKWG